MIEYVVKPVTLTKRELDEIIKKLRSDDISESERKECHLKILQSIAKFATSMMSKSGYEYGYHDLQDLMSEVYTEILLHIPEYDISKGALTTFMKPHIAHAIRTHASQKMGLTIHEYMVYMHIRAYAECVGKSLSDVTYDGYMAWNKDSHKATKLSTWYKIMYLAHAQSFEWDENAGMTGSAEDVCIEEMSEKNEAEKLEEIISRLTPAEQIVINERFRNHREIMTYPDISKKYGRSATYWRRLCEDTIAKIINMVREEGLYDD